MRKDHRRLITGALVGNVMEFFDFIVYVYLITYITKNFFPHESAFIAKIFSFSVFASGYLTRPLGAVVFGFIGDKFGRKAALIQSIVLITMATTGIGLLPSYAEIGLMAPLLLVACRLLQGFAVSGEQGGAAVYLSEMIGPNRNGFIGSLVLGSTYFGVLLGSLTCLVISSFLNEAQMTDYGWRIPFLLSIVLGIVSFILRVRGSESIEFSKAKSENKLSPAPVTDTFRNQWRDLSAMILLVMGLAVPIYMYNVYMPTYLAEYSEFGVRKSLMISTIALLMISCLVPSIGRFSDKIGNEKVMFTGFIASLLLGYPIFLMLSSGSPLLVAIGLVSLGLVTASIAAPMFGVLINIFPTNLRYTGVSLVFNTSMAIFGGTLPMVCVTLIEFSGQKAIPGIYLCLSGIVGTIILHFYTQRIQNESVRYKLEKVNA